MKKILLIVLLTNLVHADNNNLYVKCLSRKQDETYRQETNPVYCSEVVDIKNMYLYLVHYPDLEFLKLNDELELQIQHTDFVKECYEKYKSLKNQMIADMNEIILEKNINELIKKDHMMEVMEKNPKFKTFIEKQRIIYSQMRLVARELLDYVRSELDSSKK